MPGAIIKYKKRLSGPLLDRIDIHVDAPPVDVEKLTTDAKSDDSRTIRERVIRARHIQKKRFHGTLIKTNGEMTVSQIKKYCSITDEAIDLLKQAINKLSLSARSYFKIIKVAQTISDLTAQNKIEKIYIAEALQYRTKDE